ncbi:bifunctional 2-polyprenyl-6-hydroxyphenol methylase/3-demethylubiquinol 3-O-methyltransferase UbiG [Bradyrhizobium sp. Cp5.3]|uniref:class I SAM-dependent methyltransferase n=1 Tax=Bradyrhizobium sp. Cp5.3 TaxID=443598 RepID=UPI00041D70B7|nr:class I SAM-dependent methyltransferase [Bradyrhizobium sp. Cp5.3]
MEQLESISGYTFDDAELNGSHDILLPCLLAVLEERGSGKGTRVMDLGCGNGAVTELLHRRGHSVVGVDPSESGIRYAREKYPHLQIDRGSAYEPISGKYGQFDFVVSLEVVEHLYNPRKYAATVHSLLKPGGTAIISTPYHGYWKNLTMAVTGRLDHHFTALWDHGHIKFWSYKTLRLLLEEAGLRDIQFHRVGRIPPLAKSMLAVARK